MKTGLILPAALLIAVPALADDPEPITMIGIAGGGATRLTDDKTEWYGLPYLQFEYGHLNLSLFDAGWTQPLTEDGLVSASLALNWEEYLEDWVEDDATMPSFNLIATFAGEHNVSLFMFKYSHALWLNDINNRQTTNLAVYSGLPVWKESAILMPEVGVDAFTAASLAREFDLDTGVAASLPYASLTLIGFIGENTHWIASAGYQWLSPDVKELPEVEAEGRSEITLALQYLF